MKNIIRRILKNNPRVKKIYYLYLSLTTLTEWYVKPQIKKYINDKKSRFAVLDAGAGFGQYSYYISRRFPNVRITAMDLDQSRVEGLKIFARKFCPNLECLQANAVNLNINAEFDLILCTDVLEHIYDDTKVIVNFYRALKRNGKLILNVPIRPQRRALRFLHKKNDFRPERFGHVREGYTQEELIGKLSSNGFEIKKIIRFFGFFGSFGYELFFVAQSNQTLFFALAPFYFVFIHPFVLCAMMIDRISNVKDGNGVLVIAEKKSNNPGNEN